MAVYWYDFTATSNGTGTYASPFDGHTWQSSIASDNDEIRVKSHTLTDMTDFTFTASYTMTGSSNPTMIVPDATLFSVGDVIMYDDDKTCFVVDTVGSNYIIPYYSFACPMAYHFRVSNKTWRRLKPSHTTYSGQGHRYIKTGWSSTSRPANVLISDGWTSETTRVTDKSSMTIAKYDTAGGNRQFYIEDFGTNLTVDLQQTCYLASGTSGSAKVSLQNIESGCDFHIHQLWGGMYSAGLYINGNCADGMNLHMNYFSGYYGVSGSGGLYTDDITVQSDNSWHYSTYFDNRSSGYGDNHTYIFGNVFTYSDSAQLWDYSARASTTWEHNGDLRVGSGSVPYSFVMDGKKLTLGSGFRMFRSCSTASPVELTSMDYIWWNSMGFDSTTSLDLSSGGIELVNNTPSFTFVNEGKFRPRSTSTSIGYPRSTHAKVPIHDAEITYDSSKLVNENEYNRGFSYLIKDVNPSSPGTWEHLQDDTKYYQPQHGIDITKVFSVYKTTAPSLKFYLAQWQSTNAGKTTFVKALNLPVDGDGATQFTVNFWYTCEASDEMFNAALGGSFVARVVYDDNSFSDVSIESIAGAWTEYTIPFVPADKQLAQLQFRMDTVESGFFYISDIGVS